MMRLPTTVLEGKKLPRVIFSLHPSSIVLDSREVFPLMKEVYEIGSWCFDLPSLKDLKSLQELKRLTNDEALMGIGHLDVGRGVSFLGKPFHQFESRALSTIKKNLFLPHTVQYRPPIPSSSEVFTQKEIDRISFDPLRFEKALSPFHPEDSPFLLMGERYGDWFLALGRIDLLKEMVVRVREKGLIPLFSGQWATFVLPKAKPLDVAAYAIPVNKKWSLFDLAQACDLIKKFDKPVISLNPLADGKLLTESEEAFSFLFDELKICSAIAGISTEKEARIIFEALKRFPSLIPHRKT
jgi:hypothetical protein